MSWISDGDPEEGSSGVGMTILVLRGHHSSPGLMGQCGLGGGLILAIVNQTVTAFVLTSWQNHELEKGMWGGRV